MQPTTNRYSFAQNTFSSAQAKGSPSFSLVWPDKEDILTELNRHEKTIKQFYELEGELIFEKLPGANNAPVHVLVRQGYSTRSVGVFKREKEPTLAAVRMQAVAEMRASGCEQLPEIITNCHGGYLSRLGESSYSVIKFLEPDSDHKERLQKFSFTDMLACVKKFHKSSEGNSHTQLLAKNTLERCLRNGAYLSDQELRTWAADFCSKEDWQQIEQLYSYFGSSGFQDIYRQLPTGLIHGDNHLGNIIFSRGNALFIDFEAVKTDARLWDFVLFCGKRFLKEYLDLLKQDKLFPLFEAHYQPLTPLEKAHFNDIVLLRKIDLISRYLQISKTALARKDAVRLDYLSSKIAETIEELHALCKARQPDQDIKPS